MTLKLFGLSKCSTCRKATDWLGTQGITHSFQDLKETPVTAEQVSRWSKALGGWERMINRAGYTWRGLAAADIAGLTEVRAVTLAVKHPSLIRRPLIEHGDGSVTVGFSKKIQELLS